MNDRQTVAWLAAALAMILVSTLLWRRSKPVAVEGSQYPVLEKAMRLATSLAVGALMGLIAFLFASMS